METYTRSFSKNGKINMKWVKEKKIVRLFLVRLLKCYAAYMKLYLPILHIFAAFYFNFQVTMKLIFWCESSSWWPSEAASSADRRSNNSSYEKKPKSQCYDATRLFLNSSVILEENYSLRLFINLVISERDI